MLGLLTHAAAAGARAYVMLGEVLSVSVLLIALNTLATLTERTYSAGVTIGRFYKTHCNKRVIWTLKNGAALLITTSDIAWDYTKRVYNNRVEIMTTANNTRNAIGRAFAYQSPVVA